MIRLQEESEFHHSIVQEAINGKLVICKRLLDIQQSKSYVKLVVYLPAPANGGYVHVRLPEKARETCQKLTQLSLAHA